MKKKWISLLAIVLFINLFSLIPVYAEESEEFPYEGLYLTPEERAVKAYYFEQGRVYLFFNFDNFHTSRNPERITNLFNLESDLSLQSLVDPSITAEEIEKKREELGLDVSVKEIIEEALTELEDDDSLLEFEQLIDQKISRIEFSVDINENIMSYMHYCKLTNINYKKVDNNWVCRFLDQRIFAVKDGDEEDTIVDDYLGIYYKIDSDRPMEDVLSLAKEGGKANE